MRRLIPIVFSRGHPRSSIPPRPSSMLLTSDNQLQTTIWHYSSAVVVSPHDYYYSSRYYSSTHSNSNGNSTNNEETNRERVIEEEDTDDTNRGGRPRSPYAILKLKTSATKNDIKSSFRKLAKKYHPDLNPHLPSSISQTKMSELIQAYDQLMDDDDLSSRVGDARVALACEMFTLNELRIDRLHDVYSFRIVYNGTDDGDGDGDRCTNNSDGDDNNEEYTKGSTATTTTTEVNPVSTIQLEAHPDDSISDLKRQIQSSFSDEWGLTGRRLDRDQIATGWELIKVGRIRSRDDDDNNIKKDEEVGAATTTTRRRNDDADAKEASLGVMSYHLFLHSYDVRHGDVIHAVVRKYEEGDNNND